MPFCAPADVTRALVASSIPLLLMTSCGSETAASAESVADVAFRDALNKPPSDWSGAVFELSHDYPKALPTGDVRKLAPWLQRSVDFTAARPKWEDGWDDYMSDLLAYIQEGQDVQLDDQVGWKVSVGGSTRWFHVPWMSYNSDSGREFVHGLTKERTAHLQDFVGPPTMFAKAATAKGQNAATSFDTWAFGVYNQFGGYSIGKVVPASGVPQTTKSAGSAPRPVGLPFAQGTLVTKLLFSTASDKEVPFLANSPKWTANRYAIKNNKDGETRQPLPVHLVQIDVAVVDDRSPTGWVYGTFAYNGTLKGETAWQRLSPVGLQWGSDSKTFPAVSKDKSVPASQSALAPINIYEHAGPEGRLAGPVDNPQSSCLSCHGGAFAAAPVGTISKMPGKDVTKQQSNVPAIFDFPGMGTKFNQANAYYFQNTKFPQPYPDPHYAGAIPMDTSLQLSVAFTEYASYMQASGQ